MNRRSGKREIERSIPCLDHENNNNTTTTCNIVYICILYERKRDRTELWERAGGGLDSRLQGHKRARQTDKTAHKARKTRKRMKHLTETLFLIKRRNVFRIERNNIISGISLFSFLFKRHYQEKNMTTQESEKVHGDLSILFGLMSKKKENIGK